MEMIEILREALGRGASDIHLSVGRPPTYRIDGHMLSIGDQALSPKDTENFVKEVTSEYHRAQMERVGGVDFGFDFEKGCRFRVACFKQKGSFGLVLRLLPSRFYSFEEIGLSSKVVELCNRPRGLILVVGPTGSGKTTTLATMLNYINETRPCHIVTVEDPIEYYHSHKKAVVTQREIGADVPSFSEAVIKSLRMDPDVILIGEMRDLATMESAITAAETGHLVFATLHTTGAARTVDRIIDVFPAHQQGQIRVQLASTMLGVISQALLPRIDGHGRIAAFEIMISTPAIANLIREGKTYQIFSEIQTGAKYGSQTLDNHLLSLYAKQIVSYDEAMSKSYDPAAFSQMAVHAASGHGAKPGAAARK